MSTRPLLIGATLALAACQPSSRPFDRGLSTASTVPPSSLLRLPADGGPAALFHLPRMTPWTWRTTAPLPRLRRIIGADLDLGVVYALSARSEVVTFDLLTARPRERTMAGVREATIGPDGTLFTVDDSLRIVQFMRRTPTALKVRLPGRPRDLFGGSGASLLAISAGAKSQLTHLRGGDQAARTLLPEGEATATFWGDLVAVAADSAVVLLDPDHLEHPTVLPVKGHARSVSFSPSGHRMYVNRREGPLLVYNRFTQEQTGTITLPGPAAALRMGPWGRWMLARPAAADSIWLVDLGTNQVTGTLPGDWGEDLPTVTNQEVLLSRVGADLVAYDLGGVEFAEAGRIRGGARDLWLPLAWSPETGTGSGSLAEATDTTAKPEETGDGIKVYLQVSSSQNPAWSGELARQLARQGLPASVLEPRPGEEGYRVVLGPYASREVAESTGRQLGRPFFIYQPDH